MMTTMTTTDVNNHKQKSLHLNSKLKVKYSSWNLIFLGFLTMTGIVCFLTLLTGLLVVPTTHGDNYDIIVVDHPSFTTLDERRGDANANANANNHLRSNSHPQKQQNTNNKLDLMKKVPKDQKYYMVFSTGCTPFQNWQALAFFYFAHKVKQPGTIVRLVSGCTEKEAEELKLIHQQRVLPLQLKQSKSNNINQIFEMHITPDFGSGTGNQKYWNKPHGILHWMEESLGFNANNNDGSSTSQHKDDDSIVIILDPDMMLLRPITADFNRQTNYVGGWIDTKNTKQHQLKNTSPVNYNDDMVTHGHPHAQKYGFGNGWFTSLNGQLEDIVGPQSPALNISLQDAADYYPAGPPYVATAKDMYQLAVHWVKFLPGVYTIFPQFMAEMHGYSIAAAHLQLPHKLAEGFMVSDVDGSGENFDFIDNKLNKANVCMKPPNIIGGDDSSNGNVKLDEVYTSVNITLKEIPFVIHYCQRYALGRWFFSKYKLPEDMFSNCSAPLMKEPPSNVAELYDWYVFPNGVEKMDFSVTDQNKNRSPEDPSYWKIDVKRKEHLRNGWMLCAVIYGINEAIQIYKEEQCSTSSLDIHPEFYKKTYHFHEEQNFTTSITDPSNPFTKKLNNIK